MNAEQYIFNIAVPALRKQAKGSYSKAESMCMYRGPGGTKCAIGWCISDEHYKPKYENNYAGNLAIIDVVIASNPDMPDVHDDSRFADFLVSLQNAHDDAARYEAYCDEKFLDSFEVRMARVADKYKLEIPA